MCEIPDLVKTIKAINPWSFGVQIFLLFLFHGFFFLYLSVSVFCLCMCALIYFRQSRFLLIVSKLMPSYWETRLNELPAEIF